jgi:hypothetical protein
MKIDYIDNHDVDLGKEDKDFDIEMTLGRLCSGLFWLYGEVGKVENIVRGTARRENVINCIAGGLLETVPTAWLTCAHQWYATSLDNYVNLVGWRVFKRKNDVKKYVEKVIPVVSKYRNKVAAHFSITDPWNDNPADVRSSIITNIVFAEDQLLAGALSEIISDDQGNEIKVSHHTSWNLVNTHRKLIPRYWPNGPLPEYQSLKISARTTRKFVITYPKT